VAAIGTFGVHAAISQTAGGGSSPSTNPNTYTVAVEADGLNIGLQDNSLPLVTKLAASPYAALANLDSIGTSSAQAGAPYLGSALQTIVGTVNGLGHGAVPSLPPPPGYVASSYPSAPTTHQANGPYSVTAESSANESTGNVSVGLAQPGSTNATVFATAHAVANSVGSVTSSGAAGADLLNIGGILDIGNVSSTVTVTQQGSQAPQISTHTDLGTITVLGLPIGINEHGINVVGANVPLPTNVLNQTVSKALAAAGITLKYLPATTQIDPTTNFVESVESGALELTMTQNVPTQGPVTVAFTFARVKVSSVNTAVASDSGTAGTSGTDSGTGGPATPSTDNGSGLAASATGGGTGSNQSSGTSSAVLGSAGTPTSPSLGTTSRPALASPGTSSPTGTPRQTQAASGPIRQASATGKGTESAYLMLVLAALAVLGGSQIIRLLSIRMHQP
jgi:hypothetical protein